MDFYFFELNSLVSRDFFCYCHFYYGYLKFALFLLFFSIFETINYYCYYKYKYMNL